VESIGAGRPHGPVISTQDQRRAMLLALEQRNRHAFRGARTLQGKGSRIVPIGPNRTFEPIGPAEGASDPSRARRTRRRIDRAVGIRFTFGGCTCAMWTC